MQLVLQGDSGHVYDGFIESFDNRIDTATSDTIRARARFANTDGALVPGMFATVRLAGAAESNPSCSCRSGRFPSTRARRPSYMVDAANKVKPTARSSLGRHGGDADRVVESGLSRPGTG